MRRERGSGWASSAIADLGQTRCVLRDEWLAAARAGDRAGQDAATGKLSDLITRYRAGGVQPNGDISLVVDRLIEAMRSRVVASVQSEACN